MKIIIYLYIYIFILVALNCCTIKSGYAYQEIDKDYFDMIMKTFPILLQNSSSFCVVDSTVNENNVIILSQKDIVEFTKETGLNESLLFELVDSLYDRTKDKPVRSKLNLRFCDGTEDDMPFVAVSNVYDQGNFLIASMSLTISHHNAEGVIAIFDKRSRSIIFRSQLWVS